jgi:hypothetical protein
MMGFNKEGHSELISSVLPLICPRVTANEWTLTYVPTIDSPSFREISRLAEAYAYLLKESFAPFLKQTHPNLKINSFNPLIKDEYWERLKAIGIQKIEDPQEVLFLKSKIDDYISTL